MMLSKLHNTYEYFEYQIIKVEGVTCFFTVNWWGVKYMMSVFYSEMELATGSKWEGD